VIVAETRNVGPSSLANRDRGRKIKKKTCPGAPILKERNEIGFCSFTHTRRVGRPGDDSATIHPTNITSLDAVEQNVSVF
jgi:hypothetical protein